MPNAPLLDPFAGVEDDPIPTYAELRNDLLDSARRGFSTCRKEWVQRRRGGPRSEPRGSMLGQLVHRRLERALDAYLLVLALHPVTEGDPLDVQTWANLLSTDEYTCTPNMATKAFSNLAELKLVTRTPNGRRTIVTPLNEVGDGTPWTKPGAAGSDGGPGYFTIPHAYWSTGLHERLTLPGKAMFLILLHDTQSPKTPRFSVPLNRMSLWYGISERTAERGYEQLREAKVLLEHDQWVKDGRSPIKRRLVVHRALASPYGTADRQQLQRRAKRAVAKKAQKQTNSRTPTKKKAPAKRGGLE